MEVVVEASGILDTPRHCSGRCPLQSRQSSQWWKSSKKQHYCCSQVRAVLDCFTARHGSNRLLSKQEATKTEEKKKRKTDKNLHTLQSKQQPPSIRNLKKKKISTNQTNHSKTHTDSRTSRDSAAEWSLES